jgi:hypothetical protein
MQQSLPSRNLIDIQLAPGISLINHIFVDSGPHVNVLLTDSGGAFFKSYQWQNVFSVLDVWKNIVITWNGTSLLLYINGVATIADVYGIDNAGVMTDTPRSVYYGAFDAGSPFSFPGYLGHLGLWDSILTAGEATEIYNNGFAIDLKTDFGSYVSSASLKHYWRPGFADVGFTDEQASPTSIDFDDSVNLDASDIVNDAP